MSGGFVTTSLRRDDGRPHPTMSAKKRRGGPPKKTDLAMDAAIDEQAVIQLRASGLAEPVARALEVLANALRRAEDQRRRAAQPTSAAQERAAKQMRLRTRTKGLSLTLVVKRRPTDTDENED